VQQKRPNQEKPIDLEKLFYNQKIDFSEVIKNREISRKGTSSYSLEPFNGEFGYSQKKHLLNRSLIGYSHDHLKKLDDMDLNKAIERLFNLEDKPNEPTYDFYYLSDKQNIIEDQIKKGVPDRYAKWVENGEPYQYINYTLMEAAKSRFSMNAWLLKNFANQNTSIHWRLTLFIFTIIPVWEGIAGGSKFSYEYFLKLFNHSFASYKDLIYEITTDFGMLRYLNLDFSKKENPDENFARELLELYTVGKEGGAKFSESDVKEISKILTGWHCGSDSWLYYERKGLTRDEQVDQYFSDGPLFSWFDSENHDSSDKQLSQYFNNKTIKGREGEDGRYELEDLIEVIFENKDTSKYISRRIYQFFINPIINDEIEERIIAPLSEIFIESNYNIGETAKVLLSSEHFFDSLNYNSIIKSPLEFFMSIFKELHLKNVQNPTAYEPGGGGVAIHYALKDPKSKDYFIYNQLFKHIQQSGYDITAPPSVSGWKPYYQKPIFDMFWINTYTLKKRAQLTGYLIGEFHVYLEGLGRGDGSAVIRCDLYEYISDIEDFKNIDSFINGICNRFLNSDPGGETKSLLKNSILNEKSELYWTQLIEDYELSGSRPDYISLSNRVKSLFQKIFQLEEINTF
jgi:uncharacterized protein (DUF1800 family)